MKQENELFKKELAGNKEMLQMDDKSEKKEVIKYLVSEQTKETEMTEVTNDVEEEDLKAEVIL